jgi:hypothetical protein
VLLLLLLCTVLLGPLRAITYVLMHGVLAASLGSMWVWKWPWAISIPAGATMSYVSIASRLQQVLLWRFAHWLLGPVSL